MSVHSKEEVFSNLDDEVFGTSFLPRPLPKYRFPGQESDPTAAYQLVHDELLLDGNSRQNLATFCQTWVEPEVRKLTSSLSRELRWAIFGTRPTLQIHRVAPRLVRARRRCWADWR